ncbi:MAG TPA: hypothetical protein VHI51_19575 [Ktedonobacterales bacterium]|nr:hypothetical protein [Ktedonobacterales bacterium]
MNQSNQRDQAHAEPRARVLCPYCGAEETEPLALFGQQLLTVQMYCQRCHTPFEYVKDDAILDVFQTRNRDNGDNRDKGDIA